MLNIEQAAKQSLRQFYSRKKYPNQPDIDMDSIRVQVEEFGWQTASYRINLFFLHQHPLFTPFHQNFWMAHTLFMEKMGKVIHHDPTYTAWAVHPLLGDKKDMDIGLVFYEVMPNGELFQLSYFIGRASYAKDMSVRRLLTPGKVESIPFDKTRMVSRRLGKGSRLLVTLNVNKNPSAQINYGTGKDVSDEDINDAKTALQIKWRNDSYVKIPIWK